MSELLQHMEREFRFAGLLSGTDPEVDRLTENLRDLITTVDKQNHSGGSVFQTLQLFDRLVNLKPLTPLTGADNEWAELEMAPGTFQNLRCSSVIKREDGSAVDVGMKPLYVYPDGVTVTRASDEAPVISFPYMPGFPPVVSLNEQGQPA